jgi:hypothetical protein
MTSDVAKQPDAASAGSDEAREASNLTSRAEAIARIIDPQGWQWVDEHTAKIEADFADYPEELRAMHHRRNRGRVKTSLAKAETILALPPLLDGGCSSSRDHAPDAEAACEPKGSALVPGECDYTGPFTEISNDGMHTPNGFRRWLARQLMDSRLTPDEAYAIVAHHPLVCDQYAPPPPAPATEQVKP